MFDGSTQIYVSMIALHQHLIAYKRVSVISNWDICKRFAGTEDLLISEFYCVFNLVFVMCELTDDSCCIVSRECFVSFIKTHKRLKRTLFNQD